MTQSLSQLDIASFLAQVPPFDRLGEAGLRELADRCQLLRYRIGQQILVREKLPAHVSIVYEGQVRLLGYDYRSQKNVSLQVVGAGEILGWIGLVRGVACETATASGETVCINIPGNDFLQLIRNQSEFSQAMLQQVSLCEVFELLSLELDRGADASSNLKELTFQTWPTAIVQNLPGGSLRSPQPDPNYLWLISSGSVGEHPTGSRLDPPSLPASLPQNIRLLGFPLPEREIEAAAGDLAEPGESQALVPTRLWDRAMDAPQQPPTPERDPLAPPPKYPYIKGKGVMGSAMACFQMLTKFLRIPFRRDTVQKLLEQQLKTKGEISLYGCGTIMPALNINAQLAQIPASSLHRLSAPAMIRWQGNYALLYHISEKEIVLAVPEVGILHQTAEQVGEVLGEMFEVLLMQPSTSDPSEKFSIWWFLPSLARYKKVLTEVFVASFFVQLFGLGNPILTQVVIDKVLGQRSIDTLNVLGVFMILVALFEALLTSLRTYLFVDTTNRIDLTLGSQVIDHLFRLPLQYFDVRRVGDIAGRVNELANIRQFVTGTALTVVLDALFSVIYVAVMLKYSIVLTFVSVATVPFFTVLIIFVSPIVRRLLLIRAERYADAQSYLVETLNGIQTVKAQNIELTSRWNWYERYARFMNAGFRTILTNTAASAVAGFLNSLSGLLLLWVGAYMVLKNELTLGQLIAFRIISGNVTGALLRFIQVWQSFQEVGMSIERLRDILNSDTESDEADRLNITLPNIEGEVAFDEICFRFNPSGPLQVANVNFSFPAGTFVGIVGESGSGKSTMMKLVQRLYPPTSGRIQIDGYDISKVELYSLRRQIGVVLQDTLLFNNTVKANIALNNPEATDEQIIAAAKVAEAHEFIMGLANGYNTIVGERGASLSGGQRQRIAIARTVLQKPRLLILDEATSALDYNLESAVCRNLVEEFKGRTVFFITHRLPTIQGANAILMMDKGALVEQGTHQELMALKGRYYCLYQQQESQL
jgi:ATP-binding cassette subfamily B protein